MAVFSGVLALGEEVRCCDLVACGAYPSTAAFGARVCARIARPHVFQGVGHTVYTCACGADKVVMLLCVCVCAWIMALSGRLACQRGGSGEPDFLAALSSGTGL